jgi:hypothetical protein
MWTSVKELVAWERSVLRREFRAEMWPDALKSHAFYFQDEEFEVKLRHWIEVFEKMASREEGQVALRELPLSVLLRHMLSDIRVAHGDLTGASQVLLGAIAIHDDQAHPHRAPLLLGWEDAFDCRYVKAQQCLRFGRLAVLCSQKLEAEAKAESEAEEGAHGSLRRNQKTELARQGASHARRHLLEAMRLYSDELSEVDRYYATHSVSSAADEGPWRLAISCAYVGAMLLLGEAYRLAGQTTEAAATLGEACMHTVALQEEADASPQLRRLLAGERARAHATLSAMEAFAQA